MLSNSADSVKNRLNAGANRVLHSDGIPSFGPNEVNLSYFECDHLEMMLSTMLYRSSYTKMPDSNILRNWRINSTITIIFAISLCTYDS